ncbi:unnamed protein product [Pocillopora meandrina]|uniref:Enoyl-CoA hydratase/isomerase family protein n=1 Tax=Pocillopora meandrina TaxID=46732 RepID=A0AAU9XQ56_9CNID|nr:unnamed protein product [Pocillopora meandrina]
MAGSGKVEVSFVDNYAILSMKNGENRLNLEFFKEFYAALDEIERNEKVKFLITTGDKKFYSNGLDQEFLATCTPEEFIETTSLLHKVLARLLSFPMLTVAALNGHTFAGGALLALAHDYRVMRTKKGWFSFPEVKYGMRFGIGNNLLMRGKIKDPKVIADAVFMGRRFEAEEALAGGIVHEICDIEKLLDTAIRMGKAAVGNNNFNRNSVMHLKSDFYSDIISGLQSEILTGKGLLKSFEFFGRKSKL